MGGSNSSDTAAQLAAQQNQQIDLGMQQLNNIFSGGTIGTGLLDPSAGLNPNQTYYSPTGAPVTGAAAQNLLGLGDLYSSETTTPGFTPAFYQQRAQDYVNYANPQLQQQFGQTQRNANYQLADAGLQNSGAQQSMQQSLQQALAQQEQGIANTGTQQAQNLQQSVGQEQNALTAQLEASANPSATAQSALNAAAGFSAPSAFAPVGNFFGNWSNLYQAQSAANQQANLLNPAFLQTLLGYRGGGTAPVPGVSYEP